MRAVLVDGARNTKEFELERPLPDVRVPVDRGSVYPDTGQIEFAVFDRVGTMPDGRVVYGQQGMGWQLWCLKAVVSQELKATRPEIAQSLLDDELAHGIKMLHASLLVQLYDVVTADDTRGIDEREVWGVGVPATKGA